MRTVRLSQVALVGLAIGGWIAVWLSAYRTEGLFRWLGIDFGFSYAQAEVLRRLGGPHVFEVDALGRQLQALTGYTATPDVPLGVGPVPYPPVFAWLVQPLTWAAPPVAFVVWTGINLLGAVHLARRAADCFPESRRLLVVALVLVSFPVVYAMFVGQPVILLACAFGEAYLSLLRGRDFRAGLWIGLLVIKPQYGLLVGPMLIWKRRWAAVVGASATGSAVLAASVLAAGPSWIVQFPTYTAGMARFGGADAMTYASQMINWRGTLLRMAPMVSLQQGLVIVAVLGVLTVACVWYAWRGEWAARDPERFAASIVVLLIATLLANYHSHPHGAVFLTVPLAHLASLRWSDAWIKWSVCALVALPLIGFFEGRQMDLVAWTLVLPLLALMASQVRLLGRGSLDVRRSGPGAHPGLQAARVAAG